MPKLSIITVNLNNKAGLGDTAKSVITQTWLDYEWIIIDAGSTDGSVEVIKESAAKTNKLVYWCSEPDGGAYHGMNKGIEKAGGEYCWFLNSGDCAYKNTTLEEIFANKFDEDIVYGDIVFKKDADSHILKKLSPRLYPSKLAYGNIAHQAVFTKTKILKEKNGYRTDFKIASDWAFYIKAICKEKASYKHLSVVFAISSLYGITSANPGIHEKEREIAKKEVFSKKELFFYFFSIASLRSKVRKTLALFGRV